MGLQKWVLDALFKFPKLIEVVVRIIKIAKSIEVNDPERKLGSASQQRAWGERYPKANHARTTDGILEGGFVLPRQNIFIPRTEC